MRHMTKTYFDYLYFEARCYNLCNNTLASEKARTLSKADFSHWVKANHPEKVANKILAIYVECYYSLSQILQLMQDEIDYIIAIKKLIIEGIAQYSTVDSIRDGIEDFEFNVRWAKYQMLYYKSLVTANCRVASILAK